MSETQSVLKCALLMSTDCADIGPITDRLAPYLAAQNLTFYRLHIQAPVISYAKIQGVLEILKPNHPRKTSIPLHPRRGPVTGDIDDCTEF